MPVPIIYGTDGNDEIWNSLTDPDYDYANNSDLKIYGLGGNDLIVNTISDRRYWLYGGDGNDWVVSDAASSPEGYIIGESGTDHLAGSTGVDHLDGGDDNDLLEGGVGNLDGVKLGDYVTGDDILYGGNGVDGLYGYDGNDWLVGGADDDGPNADHPDGKVSISYYTNGSGVTFSAGLYGGEGNDSLFGGAGADKMVGGTGDDVYSVDNVGDTVIEAANEGIDTVALEYNYVQSSDIYTLSDNVEILELSGKVSGYGNALDNTLIGSNYDNILNGGAGADRMEGRDGNDLYIIDNLGDTVVEAVAGGIDGVVPEINYTLPDNVENLTMPGNANLSGTGNSENNSLSGNSGDNILDGGSGADKMGGAEGNDTYIVDNVGDIVGEQVDNGTDLVKASVTYVLGTGSGPLNDFVENLTVTGTGDISGTGNALANIIKGNSGKNTLSGLGGDDTLSGGRGNDMLSGGAGSDTAVYTGKRSDYTITIATDNSVLTVTDKRSGSVNEGTDTLAAIQKLEFSDGTIAAPVNQAPASLALTAATVTENAALNTTIGTLSAVDPENGKLTYALTDNAGGLFKLSGNKLMTAKTVDYEKVQQDTVTVSVSDGIHAVKKTFTISIKDALETIKGTTAGNTLNGGIGADKIVAGAGNDTLYGGKSFDDLYGGTGKDVFVFKAVSDLGVSRTATDTIFDFSHKESDRIGLSAIDASIHSSGNNAFSFIGTDGWHKKAGELRYYKASSDTYVYGDTNGDGKTDFLLHLDDAITLKASDFIL